MAANALPRTSCKATPSSVRISDGQPALHCAKRSSDPLNGDLARAFLHKFPSVRQ